MSIPRGTWLLAVTVSAALARPASAEKPNLSPNELREIATHVITGRVMAVYERVVTEGDWRYVRSVAEARVENVEKGDAIKNGDLVYVRYWQRAWVGKGLVPPSTSGHRGTPREGDSVRVYLARNAYDGFTAENRDGGFNVIGANGFESLKPANLRR